MFSIKEVVIAYANKVQAAPAKVKRAELRYEICSTCEYKKNNKFGSEQCFKCKCLLQGKIFTNKGPEACPEKKWKV